MSKTNSQLTTINIEKRKNIFSIMVAALSAMIFVSGLNNLSFINPKKPTSKSGYGGSVYGG